MMFQVSRRRRRYLLTLIAIACSILCSLPAFASSARFSFPGNFNWSRTASLIAQTPATVNTEQKVSLFQQLDLTGEQQQHLQQIHLRYRRQIAKKKQSIVRLQQQLSDMMVGTETVASLRAKNQQLNALRQDLESLRFESMLATREILTLQQRQKFRELVKDFAEID